MTAESDEVLDNVCEKREREEKEKGREGEEGWEKGQRMKTSKWQEI